jgi:sugar O-acyltransferase (sialic acid O-acetyltransferase NeuD family)
LKVVIFGTGAFARVARVYMDADSPFEVVAFSANSQYITEPMLMGLDVVPFEGIETIYPPTDYSMFVAIGFSKVNRNRAAIYSEAKHKGYSLVTYISSKVSHVGHFSIGDNCFILENNVIQPFVHIGDDVIIWSGNHIGHDATIGNHCFIASHAVISGHVSVGDYSFIGVNATLRDGVRVAPQCVIGAGAVILRDTKEEGVYPGPGTEVASVPSSRLRNF